MFWSPVWPTPLQPVWPNTSHFLVSSKETPLALLQPSVNTHKQAPTNLCMQATCTHLPGNCLGLLSTSLLSFSFSASYNIFSGCCVCTHRNHVITACQDFLCWKTFAYSNALRSKACHGWLSNVHIHTVGLCSCLAQLMDASSSLFLRFFFQIFSIK